MNFSEALAEVLRVTNRPDKSLDAILAINKAISYCTLKGEFNRDRVTATIAIDPALYGDTISLSSLTRFRRFTYVKPTAARYYLEATEGTKIFTPKNSMQPNVYYLAGTSLTYTLSNLAASLEVEYLTYPPILDATVLNTHWMLDLMPYAIIDLASARVFARCGDDASARQYEISGMDFFQTVRKDLAVNS